MIVVKRKVCVGHVNVVGTGSATAAVVKKEAATASIPKRTDFIVISNKVEL